MSNNTKTAVIVGASRGLGLGLAKEYLARGWNVIATERAAGSSAALHALATPALRIETIDINVPEQTTALKARLSGVSIDLLFVNAGVIDDVEPVANVSTDEFTRLMVTNALSPLRVIESLDDLVLPAGTIAVMSSGLASVTNNTVGGYDVYRASKAALNTLMRSYAVRAGGKRSLIAMAPGHVRTDMGGDSAPLDVATSTRGMADTIATHAGKPGLQFLSYQNAVLPW
ncbi:MAG: SDR family NAD(P)-dependent oxidoreductase [Micavibrio sp.]|nr:SDR family NAD(P)-dependent oxidoreductase [Micavibrio sp.]